MYLNTTTLIGITMVVRASEKFDVNNKKSSITSFSRDLNAILSNKKFFNKWKLKDFVAKNWENWGLINDCHMFLE